MKNQNIIIFILFLNYYLTTYNNINKMESTSKKHSAMNLSASKLSDDQHMHQSHPLTPGATTNSNSNASLGSHSP